MDLDRYCFIDLETVPPPTTHPILERIRADIAPPASYKKPESIATWMAENAENEAATKFSYLALNPLYGRIVVASYAIGEGQIITFSGDDEADLLSSLFGHIDLSMQSLRRKDGEWGDLVLVGHNVEFDLRYLLVRAIKHALSVPTSLRRAFDPDKGRYQVLDTMKLYAGYGGRAKLKDVAAEMIGDKNDDLDGADVGTAWLTPEGRDQVITHCRRDVQRVRHLLEVFLRATR